MPDRISKILSKEDPLSLEDLEILLSVKTEQEKELIFSRAVEIREQFVGNRLHLRGLIEYSNICRKNCFYCGIRKDNQKVDRYTLGMEGALECARHAWQKGYGAVIIQTGERTDSYFIGEIGELIKKIKMLTGGDLEIALSCGEQNPETYQRWYDSGARRYLLRFETSDVGLYYRIHPDDPVHSFDNRIQAIKDLKKTGFFTGSGMMIGLPGQTIRHLAADLYMLRSLDVDMVGMGPYIEHPDTPLYLLKNQVPDKKQRLELSLITIAVLRIFLKKINIASSTALDSLHPNGREKALLAGTNVLMPNLTPVNYRKNYFLYENKPWLTEADELINRIRKTFFFTIF
jgi:biotin synthase